PSFPMTMPADLMRCFCSGPGNRRRQITPIPLRSPASPTGWPGDPVTVPGTARDYIDVDPPVGTHVYVGVASRQGGTSSIEESVLVIGAGEVEQEVPIEVPYEFTEIYDITSNPTAPEDGARFYCTDSANGQIYALDANFAARGHHPQPLPGGCALHRYRLRAYRR
ncbi:MAG: hypothetical protein ACJ0DK_08480, partial [Planctomycetota bacterium]